MKDGLSTIVFDEILAHVSTKAVAKVYEVATALPQQLRLEQVQRSLDLETWPRQFNIRPPTDGSIALYFFADNGERYSFKFCMEALQVYNNFMMLCLDEPFCPGT